jgi:Rps23 Pro-64 3,4-dihydroxylase Tpa1-like proline 4-hydroxylase
MQFVIKVDEKIIEREVEDYTRRIVASHVREALSSARFRNLITGEASKHIAKFLESGMPLNDVSDQIQQAIKDEVARRTKAILKNL